MCGIAGILSSSSITSWQAKAIRASDALAHRGPDGEGFLAIREGHEAECIRSREALARNGDDCRAVLLHRRLSIVDLVTGDQPMRSANGGLWTVFNGEIYNHDALRDELRRSFGVQFRTRSDTEVVLEAYRVWGIEGLARLNGMFALALWDEAKRELVLARDPLGVKPLYWGEYRGTLWFASELKVALALDLVPKTVDRDRLAEYLLLRFVPAPGTLWAGASKVRPGHALRFDVRNRLIDTTDFAAAPRPRSANRPQDLIHHLSQGLQQAVARQLMSDVPVGAFLSGGLDSSLLVACMNRTAGHTRTFAVGFPTVPGLTSELTQARYAAQVLQTRHRERTLERDHYFDALPTSVWHVDEPVVHPGMLLQDDLSALARGDVKVVLTGQGADEPLGGYPRHHAAKLALLWSRLPRAVRHSTSAALAKGKSEALARWSRLVGAPDAYGVTTAMFSPLTGQEARGWVRGCSVSPDSLASDLHYWWDKSAALDPMARLLYLESRTSLSEDLLLVADRMSMRHSLEVRVPFLDLDYLRVIESIPGWDRVRFTARRKHLQFALARHNLPPDLERSLRPSGLPWMAKRGFDVPVTPWFRGRIGQRLRGFLGGRHSMLPEYLDATTTDRIVQRYLSGSGTGYRVPLALFVLECWLRLHVGEAKPTDIARAWRGDDPPSLDGILVPGALTRASP